MTQTSSSSLSHFDRPVEDKVGGREQEDLPLRRGEVGPCSCTHQVGGGGGEGGRHDGPTCGGVEVEPVAALQQQLPMVGLKCRHIHNHALQAFATCMLPNYMMMYV